MINPPQANALICPRCGQSNECGFVQGKAECWCMQQPVVGITTASTGTGTGTGTAVCYCQFCLAELTTAGEGQQGSAAQQYKPEGTA